MMIIDPILRVLLHALAPVDRDWEGLVADLGRFPMHEPLDSQLPEMALE